MSHILYIIRDIRQLASKSSRASGTRCDSLLMKTYAWFSSIASGEISTQSQVRPSSSPNRKEHEKDRLIASFLMQLVRNS